MENNSNSIYNNIEKNEQNKEQIIDKKDETILNNTQINKEKKQKGFVRIFRNYIKKKDIIRKEILKNRFKKWEKESLKDSVIKKRIIIRISVSREKDPKIRLKNRFNMEIDNEKDKSKSVNKKIFKSIDKYKYPNKNNIKKEKIDDNNQNNNFKKYDIAKKIKNYKGVNNTNENNRRNNISNVNVNIKPEKKKLIEINNEKPKPTPNNNPKDKNINLYPVNNLNTKFIEINYSNRNNDTKNKTNNNKIYKKIEPSKIITKVNNTNKREINNNNIKPKLNYDNMSIIYSSASKNNKTESSINTYNSHLKNINKDKDKDKDNNKLKKDNTKKVYYKKFEGYHDNKNEPKNKINNAYESNKNKTYKKDALDNNSFTQDKNNNYMVYKMNTYQNPKIKKLNNKIIDKNNYVNDGVGNYSSYTSRRDSNSTYSKNSQYSQLTARNVKKGGVTTVIQHYKGRRNKYEQYNTNSTKK